MSARDEQPHAAAPGDPSRLGGAAEGVAPGEQSEADRNAGRARNTIIFSIATGLSRIAGLIREIFASALYGASGPASAFTVAFAVPNLLRALFADMALSAAFVPVFTELLEQKKRREALLLLSTLFWVLLGSLAVLVGVAMLTAPLYMPLFVGEEVTRELGASGNGLTVGLSQVMLPTVLLLGLNGLFVGALNAYDHFTVPALSPLVWNVVIIVVNLALLPAFGGTGSQHGIYAQAVGVLVGTVAQLLMAVPVLRRYGIRLVPKVDIHDPRLRQVLVLMVPVAISLGLINFSALVDSILASHVSDDGPRAIEAAFRLYMLPQGVFSVAIVTVLFPVLSRAVARGDHGQLRSLLSSGMAQILVLLVPLGLLFASPPISHDIIQTLFQREKWTDGNTDTATTALIFLGISLALNGVSLLLSRTFFALQRPWANTGLAMGSLVANIAFSVLLYRPLGIAGIVIGTFVGNVVLVALQIRLLRKETGGPLGLLPVLRSLLQVLVASVLAVLAATAVVLVGQVATDAFGDVGVTAWLLRTAYLAVAILAGGVVYVGVARHLGLSELEQAGGRFVRLGVRLRGVALRVPGVRAAGAFLALPGVSGLVRGTDAVLSVVATPIAWLTAGAAVVSRALVGLVPAGPEPAPAGPGSPGGGRTRTPRRDRADARTRRAPSAPAPEPAAPGAEGPVAPEAPTGCRAATAAEAAEPTPSPATEARPPRGRRSPRGSAGPEPAVHDATDGEATTSVPRPEGGAERPSGSGRPAVPGIPSAGGDARSRRPEPPSAPPETADDGPELYDAEDDWPTIGQRGGETLDVPWPGVERGDDEDPFDDPEWDDDVAPSRLEAYGVGRPEGRALTPEQEARAAQRDTARRLIAAREEALARMAERERRRKEQDAKRGRRRRGR